MSQRGELEGREGIFSNSGLCIKNTRVCLLVLTGVGCVNTFLYQMVHFSNASLIDNFILVNSISPLQTREHSL